MQKGKKHTQKSIDKMIKTRTGKNTIAEDEKRILRFAHISCNKKELDSYNLLNYQYGKGKIKLIKDALEVFGIPEDCENKSKLTRDALEAFEIPTNTKK